MTTTLEAGRDLDARVAEQVMGWGWMRADTPTVVPPQRWLVPPHELGDWGHVRPADGTEPMEQPWWLADAQDYVGSPHHIVPHFSTDLAAAWLVVEQMRAKGWRVRIGHADGDRSDAPLYYVDFWNNGKCLWATDAAVPLAISRAALAAVGA